MRRWDTGIEMTQIRGVTAAGQTPRKQRFDVAVHPRESAGAKRTQTQKDTRKALLESRLRASIRSKTRRQGGASAPVRGHQP